MCLLNLLNRMCELCMVTYIIICFTFVRKMRVNFVLMLKVSSYDFQIDCSRVSISFIREIYFTT